MTMQSESRMNHERTLAAVAKAIPSAVPKLTFDFDIGAELPERDWLIKDLALGPGAANGLFGFSFSAKSLMAQDIAVAGVLDRYVWGQFRIAEPFKTLH